MKPVLNPVLFLDFDGVTHPEVCTAEQLFCCLPLIEEVLRRRPGVDIVISSSWRANTTACKNCKVTSALSCAAGWWAARRSTSKTSVSRPSGTCGRSSADPGCKPTGRRYWQAGHGWPWMMLRGCSRLAASTSSSRVTRPASRRPTLSSWSGGWTRFCNRCNSFCNKTLVRNSATAQLRNSTKPQDHKTAIAQ